MKTIPEKIEAGYSYFTLLGSHTRWVIQVMAINKLIDVVTEQQKEIEQIKTVIGVHGDELLEIRNSDPKPYSAQRSTGEYCVCAHIGIPDSNICTGCNKSIKPQEDIENIVIDLICEAWDLGYRKDGKNRHLIQKYTDKILEIVRGA